MTVVPELSPQDVGTPVPVAPYVAPETYTYDYIIIGGKDPLVPFWLSSHMWTHTSCRRYFGIRPRIQTE